MIDFISFLFAIGVGFGLSFFIYGTLLDKSNNIGDSKGDKNAYSAHVNFTMKKDRLSGSEKNSFSTAYSKRIDNLVASPNGSELVRRLSDKELERFNQASPQGANGVVSPAGAASPAASAAPRDVESEIRAWEKSRETASSESAPQIFKPLTPGGN